jgi:hypothetical protein
VDGNGRLVEDRRWNPAACNPQLGARGTCRPVDALLSGAIATYSVDPPTPAGTPSTPLPAVLSQRTAFGLYRGDQLTRIDSMAGPTTVAFQYRNSVTGANTRTSSPRAFTPYPVMGAGKTQVVFGDGGRYEVRYRDETRLVRILRVERAAMAVTDEHLAQFREAGSISNALLDIDKPGDSVPHFVSLNLDDADRLWVSDYSAGPDGRGATIFHVTGRPIARVTLPTAGLQIFQIGADFVLGSEAAGNGTGSDGRPLRYRRVVMYKIETGGN